jgi:hypothetical protein
MNMKKIVIAVGLALGSTSVMAVDLTSGVAAGNTIYIAGATAQTANISKAIVNACTTTPDAYVDDSDGKSAVVWVCPTAVTAGNISTGKTSSGLTGKFIVVKYEVDGSFSGVGPLINGNTITYPILTDATDNTAAGASTSLYTNANIKGRVSFTNSTNAHVPDIALSDVEVDIWRARGNEVNGSPLATTGYTQSQVYALQGFGVGVSPLLYAAMQTDQGINSATCSASACQPSISRAQYASLVQSGGQIAVWKKLLPNTPVANLPTGATVRIAARVATSGTQASSDMYFLGLPCQNGSSAAALNPAGALTTTDTATTTGVTGYPSTSVVVARLSSSSSVRTSLETDYTIGVLSLENGEPTSGVLWKYLKVDGASPTFFNNVADSTQKKTTKVGQYSFAYNMALVKRTSASANSATFADYIVSSQGDGTIVASSKGLLADPQAEGTFDTNGTTRYSRGGLSCSAFVLTSFE